MVVVGLTLNSSEFEFLWGWEQDIEVDFLDSLSWGSLSKLDFVNFGSLLTFFLNLLDLTRSVENFWFLLWTSLKFSLFLYKS